MTTIIQQPAIADQRRFDRASWVTIGSILLFFVWTLPLAITQMRRPSDGCLLDTTNLEAQVVTVCFANWPTPLRAGDLIMQVAGVSTAVDIANTVLKQPPGWTGRSPHCSSHCAAAFRT